MKTFRVLIGAFALLLAAGLTFAGQMRSSEMNIAYLFSTGSPNVCQEIETDCGPFDGAPCFLNGKEVREHSNAVTQCGAQLKQPI